LLSVKGLTLVFWQAECAFFSVLHRLRAFQIVSFGSYAVVGLERIGTATRHVYRLSTDSGEVLGDIATEASPYGHLILVGDSLFAFPGDEIFSGFDLGLKKSRLSEEGSKEWTSVRPYVWRDLVRAGNRRELGAFCSRDGGRAWSHQFPETVGGMGTSPDILYVGTLKGPIFAFSPNRQ